MSAIIQSVTIGSLEGRCVLSAAQGARVTTIGNAWSRLIIGMRLAIGDAGATLSGSCRPWIGALSNPTDGLTNGPLSPVTSHFMGIYTAGTAMTRQAGPPVRYSTNWLAAKRVGAATTSASTAATFMSASPSSLRFALIVSLAKGTDGVGNWSVGVVHVTSSVAFVDVSLANLKTGMQAGVGVSFASGLTAIRDALHTALGIVSGYGGTSLSTTLNLNESTDGPLNAVCVGWERSLVPMYVSEVLFVKAA